jgi:hypothetical protein
MSFIIPSRRDSLVLILIGVHLAKRFTPSLIDVISSIGPRAKLKLFITFSQVITSLQDVYGVTISSRLKDWINAFKWFSLDILKIARDTMRWVHNPSVIDNDLIAIHVDKF